MKTHVKSIASDLCEVKEITFYVNHTSVRDRYRLLSEKHKKEMRAREGYSRSNTEKNKLSQLLQKHRGRVSRGIRELRKNYERKTREKFDRSQR